MIDNRSPHRPPRPGPSGGGRRRGTVPTGRAARGRGTSTSPRRTSPGRADRPARDPRLGVRRGGRPALARVARIPHGRRHRRVAHRRRDRRRSGRDGPRARDARPRRAASRSSTGPSGRTTRSRSTGRSEARAVPAARARCAPDARVRRLGGHRTDRRDDRALLHARHAPGLPGTRTVRRRGRLVPRRRPTSACPTRRGTSSTCSATRRCSSRCRTCSASAASSPRARGSASTGSRCTSWRSD